MELARIVHDIADAVIAIDQSGVPFKHFKPGVGPYGEPQLARAVAQYLDDLPRYRGLARTKRCPDLLIAGHWAIEFKLARPFGDNGKEAENRSEERRVGKEWRRTGTATQQKKKRQH